MLLIDKPYVSDLLIETIKKNRYPVVKTDAALSLAPEISENMLEKPAVIDVLTDNSPVYTNSENTIAWINENLNHTSLPGHINTFKNKGLFRDMLHPMYPDYRYEKVKLSDLKNFDAETFGFPFILKPAVGFFSMGIYIVENLHDWQVAQKELDKELKQIEGVYPLEVMDGGLFLIEDLIKGDEYAVDAYFDKSGDPVILNIYEHIFTNKKDVSDRAYFTSEKVINKTHRKFEQVLQGIGEATGLRNFPMHIELRITPDDRVIPIEANPLRFAGWCMTDMTKYAWGINPYEYFFNQQKPDWDTVFKGKTNKQYNVIIADIPRDVALSDIDYIDYKKFSARFSNLLHLHKTDFKKYPVFAFAFSETTAADRDEIDHFLHSNLMEYIVLK
jgi:hypothetical protein